MKTLSLTCILLVSVALGCRGQSITGTGIDQISHYTDERINPLKGIVKRVEQIAPEDLRGNYILEYDKNGLLVRVDERKKDQNLYRYIVYEYNNKGQRTKGSIYSPRNNFLVSFDYRYNNEGARIAHYYNDKISESYNYDDQGHLINVVKTNYNKEITISTIEYTVNELGKPLASTTYLERDLFSEGLYGYYDHGYIQYFRKINPRLKSAQEYFFEYEFDAQGNWIRRTIYQYLIHDETPDERKLIRKREFTRKITYW